MPLARVWFESYPDTCCFPPFHVLATSHQPTLISFLAYQWNLFVFFQFLSTFLVSLLLFPSSFMTSVKQTSPIDVASADSSPSSNKKREILVVESDTSILVIGKLFTLSVADSAMSMSIVVEAPFEASSSSSSSYTFGLVPSFLKETPPQMPCYFLVDLHGIPLFYREVNDWGEREWKLNPGSWYKARHTWAN